MNTEKLVLQPYEYWYCKQQISELVSAYHSVNDKQVILTLQTLIQGKTEELFKRDPALAAYWDQFLDTGLTREKFEKLFEEMKRFTIPMDTPSTKQIEKSFRKVKKMQFPELATLDFHELSYLGWNDSGTNRKYLIRKIDGRFTGVYGSFSTDVQKGHCAICNQISTVAFFLATTKSAGDGTYTKKGNYICTDSNQCNRQLTQLDTLERFWETVTK
ncbi:FusB/FusC family EF-G-binding protein [Enterococcus sp. AZ196]|uniref:FusB/FusC family EF-G-binding protein n=1 Tax=Enterococcus sp. AZ196 TaxID=2774659 RepID=UPI003D2D98BC